MKWHHSLPKQASSLQAAIIACAMLLTPGTMHAENHPAVAAGPTFSVTIAPGLQGQEHFPQPIGVSPYY